MLGACRVMSSGFSRRWTRSMLQNSEPSAVVEFVGRPTRETALVGCFLGIAFFAISSLNFLIESMDLVSRWLSALIGSMGILLVIGGAIGYSRRTHSPIFRLRFELDSVRWGKSKDLGEAIRYQDVVRVCCYWDDVSAASLAVELKSGQIRRISVRGLRRADLIKVTDELKRRFDCPVEEW